MIQPEPRSSPAARLRALLRRAGIIRSIGAHDVLTAMLFEQAGFEAVFVGGFGVSASLLGLPDLGFLTLPEMADQIRRTSARIQIPLIADGDTGYGELHHVRRTVQEFERAGASGIILEDQVSPKRCGHFRGKAVVSAEQMALKVRTAKAAQSDPDLVLVARTDAYETDGLDEAICRANLYGDAGADVVFVEAPESVAHLEIIPKRVRYPLLVNMLYGGKTPILPAADLEQMGYKIVVAPIESLLVMMKGLQRLARACLSDGTVLAGASGMAELPEIKALLGVDEYLEPRSAPAAEAAGRPPSASDREVRDATFERMEL